MLTKLFLAALALVGTFALGPQYALADGPRGWSAQPTPVGPNLPGIPNVPGLGVTTPRGTTISGGFVPFPAIGGGTGGIGVTMPNGVQIQGGGFGYPGGRGYSGGGGAGIGIRIPIR